MGVSVLIVRRGLNVGHLTGLSCVVGSLALALCQAFVIFSKMIKRSTLQGGRWSSVNFCIVCVCGWVCNELEGLVGFLVFVCISAVSHSMEMEDVLFEGCWIIWFSIALC